MKKERKKNTRFSHLYGDLKIQYKLFLTIMLAVAIPMIVAGIFFSTRLYQLITSDTLRQEQIETAASAPLLQQRIRSVIDVYDQIRTNRFYNSVFSETIDTSVPDALTSEDALSLIHI